MKKINVKKLIQAAKNRKQRRILIFFLVKLGYYNISVAQKIIKARRVVTMMTGNPDFTTPSPTLASVTTLADATEAAEAAMDGSRVKTEQRDVALAALTEAMKDLQAYVENVASGDIEKILSSGFDVRNPRTNPVILPAPGDIRAENTQIEGQIEVRWKPVKGAKTYVVQAIEEFNLPVPNPTWRTIAQPTKASVTFNDLNPGAKYLFRVAAINAAGISGYSEIAVCRPN